MTTLLRRSFASSLLGGFALFLAGCGGGGGGVALPTATPIGTPGPTTSGTPTTTPTTPSGTGTTKVTANQIVFVSTRNGMSELYKANGDGSNAVRITALNQTIDKPSISPDGTRLVFQTGVASHPGSLTDNLEIGFINVNGSGFQMLTNDTTPSGRPDDYNPVWSGNGRYIYWTSTRRATDETGATVDRVPHIFRMSGLPGSEGVVESNPQVVSEPSAYPSVDRTGNQLAYVAMAQTAQPIAIRNLSAGTTRRIGESVSGATVFDVGLSPDGNRIAFSVGALQVASASLRIYDATNNTRLASPPAANGSATGSAWSRDSSTLFFDSSGGTTGRRQLFSSPSPFATQTELTPNAPGDSYSPAFLSG